MAPDYSEYNKLNQLKIFLRNLLFHFAVRKFAQKIKLEKIEFPSLPTYISIDCSLKCFVNKIKNKLHYLKIESYFKIYASFILFQKT
jgi:hypothetical protein